MDNFVLNSQVQSRSENNPVTSWDIKRGNQEPNEDRSQNDPHPEVVELENSMPHTIIPEPNTIHHIRIYSCCHMHHLHVQKDLFISSTTPTLFFVVKRFFRLLSNRFFCFSLFSILRWMLNIYPTFKIQHTVSNF